MLKLDSGSNSRPLELQPFQGELVEKLLPEDKSIRNFVQEYFQETISLSHSKTNRYIRNAITVIGMGLFAWGCYYFIPVNNKAAGNDPALGVVLNIANATSVIALSTWAFFGTLKEVFPDKKSSSRNTSRCVSAAALPPAVVIGLLSQAAVAFIAYEENGNKILPAVVLFAADSPLPILSTHRSLPIIAGKISRLLEKFCYPTDKIAKEIILDRARSKLCQILDVNRDEFLSKTWSEQLEFTKKVFVGADGTELNELYSTIYSEPLTENRRTCSNCLDSGVRGAISTFGVASVIAHQVLIGRIGYNEGKGLSGGNDLVGAVAAGITGLASLYVCGKSALDSSLLLYEKAKGLLGCGEYVQSIAEQLRPTTSKALNMVSLAIASLSWGASVGMVEDAFEEGPIQNFMKVFISAAWGLITLNAMNDLSRVMVESQISKSSISNEKDLLKMASFFDAHKQHLMSASYEELAKYINELPESVIDKLAIDNLRDVATKYVNSVNNMQAYYNDQLPEINSRGSINSSFLNGRNHKNYSSMLVDPIQIEEVTNEEDQA
jgi:hypothetical protein